METLKHLWQDHRKIVIGVAVVVIILIIAAL